MRTSRHQTLRLALALTGLLVMLAPYGAAALPVTTGGALISISDTTEVAADTLEAPAGDLDTLQAPPQQGEMQAGPPSRRAGDGAPEGAVRFAAQDSLVLNFGGEEGDQASLFGEANVEYQEATLNAYRIDMLMALEELRASGREDGSLNGLPYFNRGSEGFTGRQLAYNMRTDRGRVVEARTEMDQGFIQGDVIKVLEDGTRYAQDGRYTTCDCPPGETPSYSLRASRMKEKDEWVYTGPIQLYIFDIPTPVVLPLGFLPNIDGRRSGPLPPQYGEDQRGFYLRGWGYYWALNDYMDLETRFGIWSQGSWEISPRFRYALRDRYSGNLNFTYVREQRGDIVDPDHRRQVSQSLRWSHQQTISPFASFNANVDLSNANYLRTNTQNYQDQVRQQIGSNVGYRYRWRSGQSLNLSLSHRQTLQTGHTTMQMPSLSFTQNTFYPFQRETRAPGQRERWFERISASYTGSLRNQVTYNPLPSEELLARGDTEAAEANIFDALLSPDLYRRVTGDDGRMWDATADHRIPMRTSFRFERLPLLGTPLQLNVNPRINYRERWFMETDRREVEDSRVVRRSESEFFALREFDVGVSADTRFYGTFPFEIGPVSGLRHTVNPSLSFSYQPDYMGDFFGYARSYQDPNTGEIVDYPVVSAVQTGGMRQTISGSIRNEFQTRRVAVDTTGERQYTPINLLTMNVSSGYNLAADSLGFSDIQVAANTNILNQVNVRFNARLSPYAEQGGRAVDRLMIHEPGWSPLRLANINMRAQTSFQSSRRNGQRASARPQQPAQQPGAMRDPRLTDPFQEGGFGTGTPYADFSIPWSIGLNVNWNYTPGTDTRDAQRRATINSSFDFNLTPKWAISGNTGLDLVNFDLARTQLNISRDLDCWQMTFSWTPFGGFQHYGFSLFVKSGMLRDLLRLDVPSSDISGRFQPF